MPIGKKETLTDREIDVLKLVCVGKTSRQIADELYLSVSAVEARREHINQKTGLSNLADLTHFAIYNGFIELRPLTYQPRYNEVIL